MTDTVNKSSAIITQGDFLISSSIPLRTVFFSSSLAVVFSDKTTRKIGLGLFCIPKSKSYSENLFLSVDHGLWLSYLKYLKECSSIEGLSISVFGASNILGQSDNDSSVGFKNMLFFDKISQELKVSILFKDIGGNFCRKLDVKPAERMLTVSNSLAERTDYDL